MCRLVPCSLAGGLSPTQVSKMKDDSLILLECFFLDDIDFLDLLEKDFKAFLYFNSSETLKDIMAAKHKTSTRMNNSVDVRKSVILKKEMKNNLAEKKINW